VSIYLNLNVNSFFDEAEADLRFGFSASRKTRGGNQLQGGFWRVFWAGMIGSWRLILAALL
jgi:hypothetical protein